MRRIAFFSVLLLITSALAQHAGNVVASVPHVGALRGPENITLSKDAAVFWRDIVRTGLDGRVRIRLTDNSVVSLGSSSELRVTPKDSKSTQSNLQLIYGLIRMQVQKITGGDKWQMRTPTAVIGVIGTDFGADASDPAVTKFVCIDGSVEIRNVDPAIHGSVICSGGSSVEVRAGSPPSQPIPITPQQAERWQHVTEPVRDPQQP